MFVTQAILVGNLSQYFCGKSSLEEELSELRNSNDSELIKSKEEKIQILTRNAYLYATAMAIIGFGLACTHAWTFYISGKMGMKHRILLTAAIYEKARYYPN